MSLSQTPAYNLKAVLKETGIAADTLRAWERRYGLPRPQRTPGGHRLYSQHDIHLIKWLISKQAEGLSISRAVDLWQDLNASGRDPLADAMAAGSLSAEPLASSPASLDFLRAEWLGACLAYNEAAAEQVFNQALALYPVETVITEMIQVGLHELGELWYQNKCSVQQEHFTSALAARRLDALISAAPAPTRQETLLLACPPGEWHALPMLVLCLLLRRRGWNTVYLGANVPIAQLEQTIRAVRPALVVLSAQGLVAAASLRQAAQAVVQSGVPVAFGGRIFNQNPGLQDRFTGEFVGESLSGGISRLEELMLRHPALPLPVDSQPNPLVDVFRFDLPLVESMLYREFGAVGLSSADFEVATAQLGGILMAALELGDISYLESDLDWIRPLLKEHHVPDEALRSYLIAYAAAIRKVMGPTASEVSDWFDSYLSTN